MSQEDLAHAAGVSVQYLSGIERGQRNPTWAVLSRIAVALEIPLSDLVARAEQEGEEPGRGESRADGPRRAIAVEEQDAG